MDSNKINKEHPFSYEGIFYSFSFKDIIESKPFWISLISASVLLLTARTYGEKNLFEVLEFWASQIVSIFPNLLGFNLGGYALIIGFGNTSLVEAMTDKEPSDRVTIFQKLNGLFGFVLILQTITFLLAFIVNFCLSMKLSCWLRDWCDMINGFLIFAISFGAIWGIAILPNLVANIFTFGQMHHLYLTIERIVKEESEE